MTVKVAINGFGRIGRLVARAIIERGAGDLELVAINDLADAKSNAWLFSRDSVHGKYPGTVTAEGNDLVIDGKRIRVTAERDPANLPHKELGVDLVLECTGFFTDNVSCQKHIDAGAKKVLISAPGKGVDLTVVYGVNHDKLTAEHTIVSNASRTSSAILLCSESLIASTNGLRTRFTFLLSHKWSRSAPGCEKLVSAFAIVPKNAPTSRRNSGVCSTRFERSAISPGSQLKTRTACNRLSPLEAPEGSSRYVTSSCTGRLFFSFIDPMKFNDAFVRMGTGAGTLCFCR